MAEPDRSSQRRDAILAAAEKVFDAHGYAGTTIDAVAVAAGIAKGSVYNYFESKRDLFYQVFTQVGSAAEADITPMLSDPNLAATEKLQRLLDYWFERMSYFQRVGRLVLEFWATAARHDQEQVELSKTFQQMYARWRGQIASILQEGIQSGQFDPNFDAGVAAALIMAMLDGVQIQSIMGMGIVLNARFLAAMKRSVLISVSVGGASKADAAGDGGVING